jgi:predicted phosphodiesterase
MRRVAVVSDIHGNLPALEAVLAEVGAEEVDRVVVAGDVLWGPFQSECIAALRRADALFVRGNCERDVLAGADASSEWCREQLTSEELGLVVDWPATLELDVDGLGTVLVCHATPRSDTENVTPSTPDETVAESLAGVAAEAVVGGHTHVQGERRVSGRPPLVNAGSVGLPYQGEQGAFWVLLGPGVELRRTPYAGDAALEALAGSGFPDARGIFERPVRGEAIAESATAHFASARRAASRAGG